MNSQEYIEWVTTAHTDFTLKFLYYPGKSNYLLFATILKKLTWSYIEI